MSGVRSTGGCWTCRLRKKKCDETHSICRGCSSRGIQCYGYGHKSELEAHRVQEIKRAAESNYRARRRSQRPASDQSSQQVREDDGLEEISTANQDVEAARLVFRGQVSMRSYQTSTSSSTGFAELNPWRTSTPDTSQVIASDQRYSLRIGNDRNYGYPSLDSQQIPDQNIMDSMWWDGNFPNTYNIPNDHELGLIIHYIHNTFPLQYAFRWSSTSEQSSGTLNTIFKSKPLYLATLGLSNHHQFLLRDGSLNSSPKNISSNAERGYVLALRGLMQSLDLLQKLSGPELLKARIEVLGAIGQLVSLEVFRGFGGSWGVHIEAARAILSLIGSSRVEPNNPSYMPRPPKRLDLIEVFLRDPESRALSPSDATALKFFLTTFIWVDIISYATGLRMSGHDTFDYLHLLEANTLDLREVMGCENWAMILIANIVSLEKWKKREHSDGSLSLPELVYQTAGLEVLLETGIATLLNRRNGLADLQLDSSLVTEIFARAALIYLHTIVSGPYSDVPEIERSVEGILNAISGLPPRLLIRISWPFCVAGCVARTQKEIIFENIVSSATEAGLPIGTIWRGLMVMRESWRINRSEAKRNGGWVRAMSNLGIWVLLV